jgi:starvation-inducible DNA-binding protein
MSKEQKENQTAQGLKILLSNVFALYIRVYKFHWNVVGEDFLQFHKYFQELYEELFSDIDEIAERIRALNSSTPGGLKEFSDRSQISESIGNVPDAMGIIDDLISSYKILSNIIQDLYSSCDAEEDEATKALISVMQTDYQKILWILSSIKK